MASPEIRIIPVRFNNVHGYIVAQGDHALMIDTGYEGMKDQVSEALGKAGLSEKNLELIILTHTHFDHAGGARSLMNETGARLAVHYLEAEYLGKGRTPIPPGTRWKARLISFFGRTFYRKIEKYTPVDADILIEDDFSLKSFGISGKVIHTPGHTKGSVSVILDNGAAIVGDVMMGVSLKEHFPPFAWDRKQVLESWERLLATGSKVFYPAHGHRLKREEIVSELPLARQKYS